MGIQRKFRDWIKSIKEYVLLAGLYDKQEIFLANQTSHGAVSAYIECFMTEDPEIMSDIGLGFHYPQVHWG